MYPFLTLQLWSLGDLPDYELLNVITNWTTNPEQFIYPGVQTPYIYFGQAQSFFAFHQEDSNLLSINYHHGGAPKVWCVAINGN